MVTRQRWLLLTPLVTMTPERKAAIAVGVPLILVGNFFTAVFFIHLASFKDVPCQVFAIKDGDSNLMTLSVLLEGEEESPRWLPFDARSEGCRSDFCYRSFKNEIQDSILKITNETIPFENDCRLSKAKVYADIWGLDTAYFEKTSGAYADDNVNHAIAVTFVTTTVLTDMVLFVVAGVEFLFWLAWR